MSYKIISLIVCFTMHSAQRELVPTSKDLRSLTQLNAEIVRLKSELEESKNTLNKANRRQEKTKMMLTVALATVLEEHIRFRRIVPRLLKKALALPLYETAAQRENGILDRSCSICREPLSKMDPEDHSEEGRIKQITMVMGCVHLFCTPCHVLWKASPHYNERCPECNEPEGSSSIFTINFN